LQRLQLLVWPDALGAWKKVDHWPNREARARVVRVFERLDGLDPFRLGATTDEIPCLRFAPEAQALFDAWFAKLEGRIRSAELAAAPAFESHVSKYRSLMPGLALLFHLFAVADLPDGASVPTGGVPIDAARLAASWCDFLEEHARKVYAVELYPGRAGAHALAQKIAEGAVRDGQPVRDLYRPQWAGLRTPEDVVAALGVLAVASWARVETVETRGRPSERVRLHPDLRRPNGG
jgi:hypothetical protein